MKNLFGMLFFILASMVQAQNTAVYSSNEELPYAIIPEYPDNYTAGTVAARTVDGLGFRYYWATDGLRAEDLTFKPNTEARTTEETIKHIYQLTLMLKNAVLGQANGGDHDVVKMSFEETRTATLNNIKSASDILLTSSADQVASYKIIFKRKDNSTTEYPFWNILNGPLADAIWHVGQIVSHRRSSGNPFNSNASVFNGKLRN